MSWNHRVVRRSYTHADGYVEDTYQIHEAYYDVEPKLLLTISGVSAIGNTVQELREDLERMLKALDKPVLDYETREEI